MRCEKLSKMFFLKLGSRFFSTKAFLPTGALVMRMPKPSILKMDSSFLPY